MRGVGLLGTMVPVAWRIAFALQLGHAVWHTAQPRARRMPAVFVRRNRFE